MNIIRKLIWFGVFVLLGSSFSLTIASGQIVAKVWLLYYNHIKLS